ncbi:unnamed protein product, partial [Phaeothamnion confervicola]
MKGVGRRRQELEAQLKGLQKDVDVLWNQAKILPDATAAKRSLGAISHAGPVPGNGRSYAPARDDVRDAGSFQPQVGGAFSARTAGLYAEPDTGGCRRCDAAATELRAAHAEARELHEELRGARARLSELQWLRDDNDALRASLGASERIRAQQRELIEVLEEVGAACGVAGGRSGLAGSGTSAFHRSGGGSSRGGGGGGGGGGSGGVSGGGGGGVNGDGGGGGNFGGSSKIGLGAAERFEGRGKSRRSGVAGGREKCGRVLAAATSAAAGASAAGCRRKGSAAAAGPAPTPAATGARPGRRRARSAPASGARHSAPLGSDAAVVGSAHRSSDIGPEDGHGRRGALGIEFGSRDDSKGSNSGGGAGHSVAMGRRRGSAYTLEDTKVALGTPPPPLPLPQAAAPPRPEALSALRGRMQVPHQPNYSVSSPVGAAGVGGVGAMFARASSTLWLDDDMVSHSSMRRELDDHFLNQSLWRSGGSGAGDAGGGGTRGGSVAAAASSPLGHSAVSDATAEVAAAAGAGDAILWPREDVAELRQLLDLPLDTATALAERRPRPTDAGSSGGGGVGSGGFRGGGGSDGGNGGITERLGSAAARLAVAGSSEARPRTSSQAPHG